MTPAQPATKAAEPFAFADFSWTPGGYAPPESVISTKYFTGEFRLDTDYNYSFNNPKDDTISGSSEIFRHRGVPAHPVRLGGDFNYNNVGFAS